MPPIGDGTETVEAGASSAVETASPAGTDGGSPTSGEAVADTRTPGEMARDEFLEKYGAKEEEPAQADPPPADTPPPAEATPEATPEDATTERQPDAGDAKTRLTDEEFKSLTPKAQQRMGYLTDQARRAKRDRDTALAQVEEFREGHEAITSLRSFAEERNLRPEDVTASLNIAGLIQQGKFGEFLTAIKPWMDMAMEATGQALSPEIEALVESGEISRDAGLRMTKTERARALAEERAQAAQSAVERSQQVDQETDRRTAIRNAVTAVEAELRASDPDWALKAPAITAEMKRALKYGAIPRTAEQAGQMLRDIHAGVILPPKPSPRPTNPQPDASSGQRPLAPPKNTRELVERTWAEMQRA